MLKLLPLTGSLRGIILLAIAMFSSTLVAQFSVNVTGEDIVCFGLSSGTATATPTTTGTSPYAYRWNTGETTATIANLTAGTYSVTVTDNGGQTATGSVTLSEPDAIVVDITEPDECSGPYIIAAEPSGGVAPYRYNWATGADTRAVSVGAGTYCVTVVDNQGCGYRACTTVEDNPPAVDLVSVDVQCAGGSDGVITANPSGGVAPYTYAWSNTATTRTIDNLAPGAYRVTLTDARGCTDVASAMVRQPTAIDITITGDLSVCDNAADATVNFAASGGTGSYTFVVTPGNFTGSTIGPLAAGTYTVTATDANECTASETFIVTETPKVEIDIIGDLLLCGAGTTGTLSTRSLNTAAGTLTYQWNTGAVGPDIPNTGPGTYSVTATNAEGCTDVATATVRFVNLNVALSSTPTSCNDSSDGTATATPSGGTAPYTYAWSTGATTQTITGLGPGNYRVTVTEADNCKATGTVTVTAPDPLLVVAQVNNVTCADLADGRIDLSVSGGTAPYTFDWNDDDNDQDADEDRTGLDGGTYMVVVTDARGCSETVTVTVNEPDRIYVDGQVTNISCHDDDDGRIVLDVSGGTAPYAYSWTNGATTPTLTDLDVDTYTVTVTDANDCGVVRSFDLTSPTAIVVSGTIINPDCFGDNDGSIDVTVSGGTGSYTYDWADNAGSQDDDQDRSGLAPGVYTVTVRDGNGCSETANFTVMGPSAIAVTAVPTNVSCAGGNDGAINVSVSGGVAPFSFDWSDDDDDQDNDRNRTGLSRGPYTVTVTDANGCEQTATYQITTVSQVTVTGTVTAADCNGEASGSIDLAVSGGTAPYAYQWTNGAVTQDLDNLIAGTYTVTVSDANECSSISTYTVTEPAAIRLSVTNPDIVCGGTSSGLITVFAAGGTGPYSYAWNNGETDNTIENVPAGTYSVTVTDANGCSSVTNGIVLDELPALECAVEVVQEPTMGDNGRLTVDVDGGTQPYTYVWSNDETTESIDGLSAGTYSVTVTDANNCVTTCTATLRALAGLGDFVWEDRNANGQQDPGEPGIPGYPVSLKNAAGMIIATTTTDANGMYSFMGLEPGTYSVLFAEPEGGNWTLTNTGDDATDSDADPTMGGMTAPYVLDAGEFDMTVDAGFVPDAQGGIVDPCTCLNNNTTDLDGQFSETIELRAFSGQTWAIVDSDNLFLTTSQAPPLAPVAVADGTLLEETPDPQNPGMSVYRYEFLLVDSLRYRARLSNGAQEIELVNQCFYPVVRFRELPPETICRFDDVFTLDGFGLLNGADLPGQVVFTLNGQPITEIDPDALPLGNYEIVAEFIPDPAAFDDGIEFCRPRLFRKFVLIDDCAAKLGDLVFLDENLNGIQDPGEPGIGNVVVTVTSQDGSYSDQTTTDQNGMYMFSVPPGTYKITFGRPDGLIVTTTDAGDDDELDSDVMPNTLMTDFYTVGVDDMDFSIDAGFVLPCIENVSNPGTIGFSQEICGPGNVPEPLVELTPATGGQGEISYLWMMNTVNPNQDISYWTPIPNSNTPDYAPGPVFEKTYFARCVRTNRCRFIESNIVTIDVGDDAVADISGPGIVCVGEEATFEALNPGSNAVITWSFTGNSAVGTASGSTVTTSWSTFGPFSVTLTVTANGCTSYRVMSVYVVNNPASCGGNLRASGSVDNLQAREVTVEWQVPADGTDYRFELERSTDGVHFAPIAEVSVPAFVSADDIAMFREQDVSPLAGRTFYRVHLIDEDNGHLWSNVLEMQLASGTETALGRVFPNPAQNGMIHVELRDAATGPGDLSVQLIDMRGHAVGTARYGTTGSGVVNLPVSEIAAGVYLLRLTVDGETETHRVIVK